MRFSHSLWIVVLTSTLFTSRASLGQSLLTQPPSSSIPGNFSITNQPFPDPTWVIKRRYPGYPVYGLFAYFWSYKVHRAQVNSVGWPFFRLAGPITDQDMLMLMQDGNEASFHLGANSSLTAYPSEEAFLQAAEIYTVAMLMRYGKNGTFFGLYPQYADRHIRFVHLVNEPNFQFLTGNMSVSGAAQVQKAHLYAKLYFRLVPIIRAGWPEVTILGFEVGSANPNSANFISTVYELYPNIHDTYDILTSHPGVDPVPPEADIVQTWGSYSIAQHKATIDNILRVQGQGTQAPWRKPVWFTEAGWKIPYSAGGTFQGNEPNEVPPLFQAAYVCRYYALALRLAVDRVTPFFIEDINGLNGGFFDGTGAFRPSAYAVQTMMTLMPAPKLNEVLQDGGASGTYVYRFLENAANAATGSTLMAWNVGGPKSITLNLSGVSQIQITDMLGGSIVLNGNGTFNINIGPYPIWIKEL